MFKLRVIAPVIVMAMFGMSLPALAIISGSSHDFSGETWTDGRICYVCHTPHDADTTVAGAPLWDHEVTGATGTYTLYTSDTLDATITQPDHYSSSLCLSCHDGTVAKDSFGGAVGTDFMLSTEWGYVGLDLTSEHPINFQYDATLTTADDGLFVNTSPSGLGGTIAEDLLFSETMGCASCHDVHNADGFPSMLRKDNAASAFCLTCHDK